MEILSIIVTEMVVAHTAGKTKTATNEEIAHDGLETSLTALEVRAGNERALDASVLNDSGVESVLGRAVQVEDLLLDGGNAVKYGGRKGLVSLNAGLEVIEGIDLGKEEHLSVSSPEHDNLVALGLLLADLFLQSLDELAVGALHDVVGAIALVSSDVIRVKGSGERSDVLKVLTELLDERRLKNAGAEGSLVEVGSVDIPAADLEVDGVSHGQKFLNRLVHILELTGFLIEAETTVSGG